MTIRNLEALLEPSSLVLVGATERPGSIGATVLRNIVEGGFAGRIDLVNPKRTAIGGRACYASVLDLPSAPSVAVIVTPPETVPGIIGQLAEKGTSAAIVLTAGIDARSRQQMLDASKPSLLRVLGPNGIGLMLPHLKLNATFAHRAALAGNLAFVSQSGALVTAMVDWAASREIGFSHVISLGDMADVDFGDLLDYLAGETQSRAILLYVEAITSAAKFMSAARRAARVKPVVVIKSGRHAAGAKAAASHTGRLAGSDAAYDAAFRRAGILRVHNLDELFEAAELLARVPRLQSERLTIITNGGGAGVLAADRIADFGGEVASLSPSLLAELDGFLPANWSKSNPIDVIGDATAARYGRVVDAVLQDPATDAVLAIHCPTAVEPSLRVAEETIRRIEALRTRTGRSPPVLANWLGGEAAAPSRKLFAAHRIPSFDTPDAAARGFMHLVQYAQAQQSLMRTPPASHLYQSASSSVVQGVLAAALQDGRSMLTEVESRALLSAAGIPVVGSVTAANADQAVDVAARMLTEHAAVVVKVLSPDITHKSDIGGVELDLRSVEQVRAAVDAIGNRVRQHQPEARLIGYTVAPMIRRPYAHELIIGMSVDPTFGPLVMFGAGGTAVEVMQDTALALPPLDMALALDLIRRTRVSRMLAGYRNRPAVDLNMLATVLLQIAALVSAHPEIRELDINPLLADANGVLALDARVRIAGAHEPPRVAMSIRPYPDHWDKRLLLDGIGGVELRPIKPEDEMLYVDFIEGVTAADSRLRFFAPKKQLSHQFVARLTQIDYAREMAFVAIDIETGRLLGVSRFSADPDFVRGEFAVLVRSDLKGRGLGWQLMQHLIDYARAENLKEIFGTVLAENTTMLEMCRDLGFRVEAEATDMTLRHVTLPLAT